MEGIGDQVPFESTKTAKNIMLCARAACNTCTSVAFALLCIASRTFSSSCKMFAHPIPQRLSNDIAVRRHEEQSP